MNKDEALIKKHTNRKRVQGGVEEFFAYPAAMEEIAIQYSEWIEKNMYCLSTDTRFPQTLGRWYNRPNPNIERDKSFTSKELYQLFLKDKI